jgi:hypothetical protein
MDNKRITTAELDFDKIKNNLKNYLKGQEQFQDYDFEGSSLSILLDILAYNTHYNSLYTNLAINEAFLDSASKRSSIVSIAKELGYVPGSATCSQATINLTVNGEPDTLLELPKYTSFSANLNNVSYNFYTTETLYANKNTAANTHTFTNVIIKEGNPLTLAYTASGTTRYLIPNKNVDLNTLRVTVQENSTSSVYTTFTRAENLLDVSETTPVYFIKEIEGQLYELEFGNGIVGKALENGNVVNLEYMTCNLDAPNGIKLFAYQGQALGTSVQVVTVDGATTGSNVEDTDIIKWNAPRAYTAQNRAVTLDDFKSIIFNYYPNAQSVNVWGGETTVPPTYGDVYISIKPKDKETLTTSEKNYILSTVLGPRKTVTIHPKLVDAEYINVALDVTAYYDPKLTSRSSFDIVSLVKNTVIDYNNVHLLRFDGILKYSNILRDIDDTEPSIVSSIVTVKLYRDIEPLFGETPNYVVNLANPIYNSGVPEESILSNGLTVFNQTQTCYIDDIPTQGSNIGQLRLFYLANNTKVLVKYVGTVNYETGIISISGLTLTATDGPMFTLIIKPQSNDVVSARNQIVTINPRLLNVNAVIDTTADNYKFTSSRN